jgi:GNAT superfamily N-acetyltransferase
MVIAIRRATMADASDIAMLIEESVRGLATSDYSTEIIEAALGSAWGLDTQLLEDGTYYLLSDDNELAACGGWSFRSTLFGSDAVSSRDSSRLLPGKDAARIRAFFVRPSFARQGLGSRLLRRCEQEARSAGFQSLTLGATEPGRRLYRRHGFVEGVPVDHDLGGGLTMKIIPMSKSLVSGSASNAAKDN